MRRHSASLVVMVVCCLWAAPLRGWEDRTRTEQSRGIHVERCRIQLDEERQMASGQSGLIFKVHVREGDRVRKGQLLVELDASIPKASLEVAAKEAKNDVNIRFARKAAEVAATEYDLAVAANRDQEQTFSEIEIEKLRLEKERSALQIEVAEHELEVARLREKEANAVVESYQIVAPIDGLVSRVYQHTGEGVNAGDPLLEIKRSQTVRIEAELDVKYLSKVKPGAAVEVIPTVLPEGFDAPDKFPQGKIFFVDVSADPLSRTTRILAEVDNQHGWLIPGLHAELIILTSAGHEGKTTPEETHSRPRN